jgi:hypothetical protein
VRVLLDATAEVGQRAGRVLLAERDIEFVGLWRSDAPKGRRSGPADDPDGFDVVVTDRARHLGELVARSAVSGAPVVIWIDRPDVPPGRAIIPIVTSANVGSALGAALGQHPVMRGLAPDEITTAWTKPGRPLRHGTATAFPDPVGMTWTRTLDRGRVVGFRNDEWGAVSVMSEEGGDHRLVGVADHATHLEALVLGATTLVAGRGGYPSGVNPAASEAPALYAQLLAMELAVAVWRSSN